MARNTKARAHGDFVKVSRMVKAGVRTYREISERTGIPLGTVCRYAADMRRAADPSANQPAKETDR